MKTFVFHRHHWMSALLLAGATTAGCGHSGPPPRELIEARAAFARASAGPAAQLSPARMKLAKQELEGAEMAWGGAPPEEVADRAYVAQRRVESAEAEAETLATNQRREKALRELASLSGIHADRARAEIAAAQQKAASEGQRASAAEQVARDEQGKTAQANASLETERQARTQAEEQARAALAELERLANVKRESRGLVITLSGQVLFVTDQATLLPAARTSLDSVAAALAGVTAETGKVVIEGHTDSTGPRDYNVTLARRRAEAVQDYLVSRGAPRDLFRVEGVGPDRPVTSNQSTEGRANNRRVEIVIPAAAKLSSAKLDQPATPSAVNPRPAGLRPAAMPQGSASAPATSAPASAGTTADPRPPAGPRPSSTSYPSAIEPPPGAVRPRTPAGSGNTAPAPIPETLVPPPPIVDTPRAPATPR